MSSVLLHLLSAVLLLALPILVYRAVTSLMHHVASDEFYQIPILTTLPRLVGFTGGVLGLLGYLDDRAFRLTEIFVPDSVWNISIADFVLHQGNLFSYDTAAIIDWILSGESPWASGVAAVAAATVALSVILCLRMLPNPRQRALALVVCGATILLTAWQTVYLTTLALWLTHRFNFWSLALIGLFLQYLRERNRH